MASVNKNSLREEFTTLKAQLEQMNSDGKVSAEVGALINALLMLFELLMAVFMEKTTPKNNRNSGLPSSQTGKEDETASQPGSRSKGPGENPRRAANTRTVESISIVPVEQCDHCGQDLRDTPSQGHERRTLIDIVFETVNQHVDAEIKECPCCHGRTKGRFPSQFAGPIQYGLGIRAYVLNLLVAQMLSLKRVGQTLHALIGRLISEATLLSYILQLHQALEVWERTAIEQLLAEPAMHVDETSLRVDRKNHWIHVYSAGDITLKFLHRKRGLEAIEAIGIIPRYKGVAIHDCWRSYLSYKQSKHGLCGSHLLRELTFVVETNDYRWAKMMKRLLSETCAIVAARPEKCLSEKEWLNLRKRYRNILTRGDKELPPIPPKQNGKRGRVAKSDAHNLWERLRDYEQSVLLFAKLPHVPFTNNRAERDLRMSKVKQKISGCFRTLLYAEAYCRISSYLQTMSYRGYNPLLAIQMALSGEIYAKRGE